MSGIVLEPDGGAAQVVNLHLAIDGVDGVVAQRREKRLPARRSRAIGSSSSSRSLYPSGDGGPAPSSRRIPRARPSAWR